ncbi:hypothetical protein L7F22_002316 [Adiantum nelumboides]|nr:hypothetical protein [Adiantum nelumboides]
MYENRYHLYKGNLYYYDRLCIPANSAFKSQILHECYNSPFSGHPGLNKTYEKIKSTFFWPGMKLDAKNYVRECFQCQQVKIEHKRMPGDLQPLDIPLQKWESISMDFIIKLPTTRGGYDSIFVVVDRLTKQAHFFPVKMTDSALTIARLFVKEIFRLHGMPKSIVSDRDSKFTSHFWRATFESIGTLLCMSTAFHPQTDGETERVNRISEDMLRMYVNENQSNWNDYLPLVEFAYNSSYHTSIRMTPFEAMYGYNCPTPINFLNSRNKVELSHEMLEKMDNELAKIRGNIRKAQKRHKLYYDKKHRVVEYEIGDMVFLKVIPEKSHLILGKDRRLSPRFAGPFKILKRIGSLAYKLELPSHVKVHPVFHVSLLKKYVPNVHHVLQDNSKLKDDGTLSVEPDLVLDRRVKHLRNRNIVELLVKWQNYPIEDASWVDLSVLQSEFPSFQL